MASTSETGHNKNVANFSTAYQILEEMGTLYNPSNSKIQLVNLDPIRNSLQNVITELNNKKDSSNSVKTPNKQSDIHINKIIEEEPEKRGFWSRFFLPND